MNKFYEEGNLYIVKDLDETSLCFTPADSNGCSVKMVLNYQFKEDGHAKNTFYSFDAKNWHSWDGTAIELTQGQKLYLKGDNEIYSTDEYIYTFVFTGNVLASGSVLSLINFKEYVGEYCFYSLFDRCKTLITPPSINAKSVSAFSCACMFRFCESLVEAPELDITSIGSQCYSEMFLGCSSLEVAPNLPSKTLKTLCYSFMFEDCVNLVSPPELPATSLSSQCYLSMFKNCKSLEEAPYLPADTIQSCAYSEMFNGCSNLKKISVGATSWNTRDSSNWVSGVSSEGVFTKPTSTTIYTNESGIPYGWTVNNV